MKTVQRFLVVMAVLCGMATQQAFAGGLSFDMKFVPQGGSYDNGGTLPHPGMGVHKGHRAKFVLTITAKEDLDEFRFTLKETGNHSFKMYSGSNVTQSEEYEYGSIDDNEAVNYTIYTRYSADDPIDFNQIKFKVKDIEYQDEDGKWDNEENDEFYFDTSPVVYIPPEPSPEIPPVAASVEDSFPEVVYEDNVQIFYMLNEGSGTVVHNLMQSYNSGAWEQIQVLSGDHTKVESLDSGTYLFRIDSSNEFGTSVSNVVQVIIKEAGSNEAPQTPTVTGLVYFRDEQCIEVSFTKPSYSTLLYDYELQEKSSGSWNPVQNQGIENPELDGDIVKFTIHLHESWRSNEVRVRVRAQRQSDMAWSSYSLWSNQAVDFESPEESVNDDDLTGDYGYNDSSEVSDAEYERVLNEDILSCPYYNHERYFVYEQTSGVYFYRNTPYGTLHELMTSVVQELIIEDRLVLKYEYLYYLPHLDIDIYSFEIKDKGEVFPSDLSIQEEDYAWYEVMIESTKALTIGCDKNDSELCHDAEFKTTTALMGISLTGIGAPFVLVVETAQDIGFTVGNSLCAIKDGVIYLVSSDENAKDDAVERSIYAPLGLLSVGMPIFDIQAGKILFRLSKKIKINPSTIKKLVFGKLDDVMTIVGHSADEIASTVGKINGNIGPSSLKRLETVLSKLKTEGRQILSRPSNLNALANAGFRKRREIVRLAQEIGDAKFYDEALGVALRNKVDFSRLSKADLKELVDLRKLREPSKYKEALQQKLGKAMGHVDVKIGNLQSLDNSKIFRNPSTGEFGYYKHPGKGFEEIGEFDALKYDPRSGTLYHTEAKVDITSPEKAWLNDQSGLASDNYVKAEYRFMQFRDYGLYKDIIKKAGLPADTKVMQLRWFGEDVVEDIVRKRFARLGANPGVGQETYERYLLTSVGIQQSQEVFDLLENYCNEDELEEECECESESDSASSDNSFEETSDTLEVSEEEDSNESTLENIQDEPRFYDEESPILQFLAPNHGGTCLYDQDLQVEIQVQDASEIKLAQLYLEDNLCSNLHMSENGNMKGVVYSSILEPYAGKSIMLEVVAEDLFGNKGSASATINLSNKHIPDTAEVTPTPPEIAPTHPDAVSTPPVITIDGWSGETMELYEFRVRNFSLNTIVTDTDDGVDSVEWFINHSSIWQKHASGVSTFSYALNPGVYSHWDNEAEVNLLTITATDTSGNTNSLSLNIQVIPNPENWGGLIDSNGRPVLTFLPTYTLECRVDDNDHLVVDYTQTIPYDHAVTGKAACVYLGVCNNATGEWFCVAPWQAVIPLEKITPVWECVLTPGRQTEHLFSFDVSEISGYNLSFLAIVTEAGSDPSSEENWLFTSEEVDISF